jgi:hypothetical protein
MTTPVTGQDPIEKELRRLSMEYMTASNKPIKNIYCDVEIFHDCKIGGILHCAKTNTEFQYMISRLPAYLESWDIKRIWNAIPDVKLDGIALKKVMQDPKNQYTIGTGSPLLSTYTLLMEVLLGVMKKSKRSLDIDRAPNDVTLYLATTEFQYCERVQKRIVSRIQSVYPTLTVVWVDKPIHRMDAAFARSMDLLMVYDLVAFLDERYPPAAILVKERRWQESMILSPYQYDLSIPKATTIEGRDEVMSTTETMLSLLCHFKFIKRELRSPSPTPSA